ALGGSMFPRFLMPEKLQKAGLVLFNSWAIDGFTNVFWREMPLQSLLLPMSVLAGVGVVFFGGAGGGPPGGGGVLEGPVPALTNRDHYPVLIIGTGIAGLTAAFCLASAGVRVLLVTKAKDPKDCNTFWAQGGIIYEGEGDSPAKLIEDILQAGAGLSNEE